MILAQHSSSFGLLEFLGFQSPLWVEHQWTGSQIPALLLCRGWQKSPCGHSTGHWTILFLPKQQHAPQILGWNEENWQYRKEGVSVSPISNSVGLMTSSCLWVPPILHSPCCKCPRLPSRSVPSPQRHTLVSCSMNLKAH